MKKNTKKIFSLILSIALVLTTIPMVSFVSFAQTVSVGTLQELQDALANESVDTITVTQRIDLPDGTIIYGNNKTVTAVKTGLNDQGIVQTGSNYSIFRTDSNATVKIYDLTIMGGSTTAVVNATGTLYLDNVTITRSGSESVTGGGGLINGTQQLSGGNNTGYESARIVMTNSSILRNVAEYGGGFVNYGTMVIDSCSLTENRSLGTAGGGGAGENQGIAYINNTTVANNTSSEIGGGINNCKGGELYLMNSTFTGNVTTNGNSSFGGAIGNNYKLVKAVNCIFAYNYYIRNDGTPEVCDLGVYDSTSLDIKHCITVDVEGKATWNTVCGETCSAKADDLFADVIQGSVLMGDGTESTEPYDRPPVVLNESGELYAPLSGEYVWDITGVPTYFDYSDLDNIRMYYTDDEGNVSADSIYAGNYDPTNPDLIKEDYDVPVSGSLDDEDRDPTLIGSSNVLPSDKVIYTVKVLASAHGSVTGGTVYGDSYISFAPGIPVSLDQIVTAKITAIPDNGYYFSGWEIVEGGSSSGDASAIAAEIQALNTLKADINTAVSDIAASITAINQNINRANNTNRTYNTVRQTLVNDTNTLVNALNGYKTTFASFNDVVSAITDADLSTETFSRKTPYRDWCDNAINTGNSVSDLLTAHISEVDASIVAKQAEYEAAIASQGTTPQGAINTSNNPLEFVIDSDITLRAMFTASAPDYTVTFHSNTDPDVTATQTFSAGNYTQNLNANTFTNEEQPFLGWAIVYCGEVVYADGTSYTASGNADLYARWGYTVEYNWNNGRNGPNSQIKIPGEALTISNTVPVKDGYTFVGWGITADATTAALQPGDEYGLDRNITLYAIWQELKAPTVINSTLDNGYLNVPYSDTIETDQEGIFVLADGSSLPAGLTIGKDGTISGTPTETGTYSFTINVYNKADTSYSDVSTITMTITISDPKSALRSLVNEANAVDQDLYTDTTADNLQDAIDEAQAVLDNPGATQDEINQAIENLTEALNQLALDKSALASAIAAGQTITSDPNATDDYTAESLAALENAILQGEIVYENSKATAAQIAQATQDILDAINNLVPIGVDTTVLVNAINTANALDEDDYTDSSWQAVEDAVTAGQAVLNNPSSTQSQINDAAQAILDAIAALELDKSGLQNAIDTANGLNEDNYTASTWDDLEDAVTAGTAVLNNPDATVDEIAQATQSILDAISNLIDKSELADKKAEAENTDTTGYDDSSVNDLNDAIQHAEDVLNDSDATAQEIQDAIDQINDAISNLTPDKSALQNAIDTANGLNEDDYTASTWDDLEDAVTAGTAVLNNPDATVDEIAQATQSILDAISNLIDKSDLADKKEEAENIDTSGYSDNSVDDLSDAIQHAEDVLNDPDATDQEIQDAIDELNDAINNLTSDVNITVLDVSDQLIESVVVTVNTTYEDIIDQLTQVSPTDGDKILVGFTDENGDFVDMDATVTGDSIIRPYYELTQIVPKSTSDYLVDRTGEDGIINGFDINANSVDEVKANLENDEFCIEVVDINGNDLAGVDKVGTGSVITYKSKLTGNVYERLTVVIYGDVDGDGIVGAEDRTKIKDVTYCTDIVSNNNYLKMASDVDGDGAFDGIDCSYISYSMHGMVCIEQARTIVLPV